MRCIRSWLSLHIAYNRGRETSPKVAITARFKTIFWWLTATSPRRLSLIFPQATVFIFLPATTGAWGITSYRHVMIFPFSEERQTELCRGAKFREISSSVCHTILAMNFFYFATNESKLRKNTQTDLKSQIDLNLFFCVLCVLLRQSFFISMRSDFCLIFVRSDSVLR